MIRMQKGKEHHKPDAKKGVHKTHKTVDGHDKCLHCGGKLFMSRDTLMKARSVWWQKPWGSVISMDEPVVSYACITCGSVFFFLRNKHKVAREYYHLSDSERKIVDRG